MSVETVAYMQRLGARTSVAKIAKAGPAEAIDALKGAYDLSLEVRRAPACGTRLVNVRLEPTANPDVMTATISLAGAHHEDRLWKQGIDMFDGLFSPSPDDIFPAERLHPLVSHLVENIFQPGEFRCHGATIEEVSEVAASIAAAMGSTIGTVFDGRASMATFGMEDPIHDEMPGIRDAVTRWLNRLGPTQYGYDRGFRLPALVRHPGRGCTSHERLEAIDAVSCIARKNPDLLREEEADAILKGIEEGLSGSDGK